MVGERLYTDNFKGDGDPAGGGLHYVADRYVVRAPVWLAGAPLGCAES